MSLFAKMTIRKEPILGNHLGYVMAVTAEGMALLIFSKLPTIQG